MKKSILHFAYAVMLMFYTCITASCQEKNTVALELPAIADSDIIVTHVGYTAAYDTVRHIPRWVAYELTHEELRGNVPRQGNDCWMQDSNISYSQADSKDYRRSGWSRGHMAPAADMKWSEQAMRESFLLTNICPQDSTLNGNSWERTERLGRRLARRYGKVWIVCGPVFYDNRFGTIGNNKVAVPDAFFKAFLVNREGQYAAIGFIMYNTPEMQELKASSMSVDEVETATGLDLFPALPDDIEEDVESNIESRWWGI